MSRGQGQALVDGVQQQAKGQRQKLHHNKFHTGLTKKFFALRTTEHSNRLLREVVEFTQETFIIHLDSFLSNLL